MVPGCTGCTVGGVRSTSNSTPSVPLLGAGVTPSKSENENEFAAVWNKPADNVHQVQCV